MDNVTHLSVIRQLFSFFPLDASARLFADRYAKKLTISKAIQVFVAAQLNRWSSYEDMETKIRAKTEWQTLFGLQSISGSQLSRKLDAIPSDLLEELFLHGAARIHQLTTGHTGITKNIGILRIVDSTSLRLPLGLGDWARMSIKESGIKMHLRLIATSPDTVFPDAMVPSTRNVGDRAASVELVNESDATYVMDRGYEQYANMDDWVERNIRFVIRMRDTAVITAIEEYSVPESAKIIRDAKVKVGGKSRWMNHFMRMIEFEDDKGRTYRLLTSRWDVTAEEITQIYKSRWLIELYFKWMKQHLRLVKVYSNKPQALWNQMYLALITSLLVQYVQLTSNTKKSPWQVLQLLQTYMYEKWASFEQELHREPTRKSRGRQPTAIKKDITRWPEIGIIKPPTYR